MHREIDVNSDSDQDVMEQDTSRWDAPSTPHLLRRVGAVSQRLNRVTASTLIYSQTCHFRFPRIRAESCGPRWLRNALSAAQRQGMEGGRWGGRYGGHMTRWSDLLTRVIFFVGPTISVPLCLIA